MRTLIAALIIHISIASFAQSSPTKEETIEWINKKINSYGNGTNKWFSDNSGRYWYTTFKFQGDQTYIEGFVFMCEGKYPDCAPDYDEKHQMISFKDITNVQIYDRDARIYLCTKSGKKIPFMLNWDSEEDLKNRTVKAFKALIKFNMPSEAY